MLGNDTASKYSLGQKQTYVVDLDLKDLPPTTQVQDLKKISGAKHVISATVNEDNLKGHCTGTGRIKLRLTNEDNLESIKLKLVNAGFSIKDHVENPNKNIKFTSEAKLMVKSPVR